MFEPPIRSFVMRSMFDLVFWSFVVSLAPLALGLGWKLFVDVGRAIDLGFSHALETDASPTSPVDEPRMDERPILNHQELDPGIPMARQSPGCMASADRRGPGRVDARPDAGSGQPGPVSGDPGVR